MKVLLSIQKLADAMLTTDETDLAKTLSICITLASLFESIAAAVGDLIQIADSFALLLS